MTTESSEHQAIEGVEITDEQWAEYIRRVEESGRIRRRNFGEDFHQGDFAMGAASAFREFGGWQKMPASWPIGTMAGLDIFGPAAERGNRLPMPIRRQDVREVAQQLSDLAFNHEEQVQAFAQDAHSHAYNAVHKAKAEAYRHAMKWVESLLTGEVPEDEEEDDDGD